MLIKSVHVQNFRSILDETLECERLTALVGANGSGKSSFLHALDLFYASSPRVTIDDFYNRDPSQPIVIAITYEELSNGKELFASYVSGDTLTVERVISWNDGNPSNRYHGALLQNLEFQEVRDLLAEGGRALEARTKYNELRQSGAYADLSPAPNAEAVANGLRNWEEEHPDKCEVERDSGQFFGFTQVAQGYLGRFTQFLFIPAVRDAADDVSGGARSVFGELMETLVRTVLASRPEINAFRERTQSDYDQLVEQAGRPELDGLTERMGEALRTYVPDADLSLEWILGEVSIPLPQADVRLIEDGYRSTVDRSGHGVQRALIFSMLQELARARLERATTLEQDDEDTDSNSTDPETVKLPDFILGIEEPELYQHPSRQRHFANVLLALAGDAFPNEAERIQVIYATHSPLFVGLDRFEQVRLLRKVEGSVGRPKTTRVYRTTFDAVAEIIWEANGKPTTKYTGATLLPRLKTLMTPWMSEGFFANTVVLVEGEDDRAAVLGYAQTLGYDFDASGIAVIPAGGKNSIDRPLAIFRNLGISTYAVWDGDYGDSDARPQDNHRLLRLMGEATEDWPARVSEAFACFKVTLETTLRDEIGKTEFDEYLHDCMERFGESRRKDAIKRPAIISDIVERAHQDGKSSPTLEEIVQHIVVLGGS